MHHIISLITVCLFFLTQTVVAQDEQKKGQFSGSFDMNGKWFLNDTTIIPDGIPQYEDELFGIEAWLNLKYRISGYEFGVRFEFYNNSNLLNPQDVYSGYGLGRIYGSKKFGDFDVTLGYIYDQIGSGIIFRSYEERALFIDNALVGGKVAYNINDNLTVSVLGGKQKNLVGWGATNWGRPEPATWYGDIFPTYGSWLYGGEVEGYFATKDNKFVFTPGIGLMSKKLSDDQVDGLENVLATYTPEDFIQKVPYYTYAFSAYNTLQVGNFAWYFEGAYKTDDTFFDQFADHLLWTGETTEGKFVVRPGYVIYNALNYSWDKVGISAEYKVTRDFPFRADPFSTLNRGLINYLPPMSRVNTYRLTARYAPATQDLGELAGQIDLTYSPSRKHQFALNMSHINNFDGLGLYREVYFQYTWKRPRQSTMVTGLQYQYYNQELYETKPGVPIVQQITPYVDYLWIFDRKKSLRLEAQYMYTFFNKLPEGSDYPYDKPDLGDWVWFLAEFSISPHWIFEVSTMWNVIPTKSDDAINYPTVGVTYTVDSHRFQVRYVKQVEGVVCSGGICRLEPAFSGFQFNVSSLF